MRKELICNKLYALVALHIHMSVLLFCQLPFRFSWSPFSPTLRPYPLHAIIPQLHQHSTCITVSFFSCLFCTFSELGLAVRCLLYLGFGVCSVPVRLLPRHSSETQQGVHPSWLFLLSLVWVCARVIACGVIVLFVAHLPLHNSSSLYFYFVWHFCSRVSCLVTVSLPSSCCLGSCHFPPKSVCGTHCVPSPDLVVRSFQRSFQGTLVFAEAI